MMGKCGGPEIDNRSSTSRRSGRTNALGQASFYVSLLSMISGFVGGTVGHGLGESVLVCLAFLSLPGLVMGVISLLLSWSTKGCLGVIMALLTIGVCLTSYSVQWFTTEHAESLRLFRGSPRSTA